MFSTGSVRAAWGAGLLACLTGTLLAACTAISGLDQYSLVDCPWGCDASSSTKDASVPGDAPPGDGGDATLPDDVARPEAGLDEANDAPDDGYDDSPIGDASSEDAEAGCPFGYLACESGCMSPADPLNCGACGNACTVESGTPSCQALPDTNTYRCVSGCPEATPTLCGSTCVDTSTSPNHCGGCNTACVASAPHTHSVCGDGGCSFPCDPGYSLCDGGCMLYTNPANCGACGAACDPDGGTPLCAPPTGTGTDGGPYACASGCPAAAPTRCNGACVDTTTDTANCSACAHPCTTGVANAHPVCGASSCSFACNPGFVLCDGACVDFTSDPGSCGGCGVGHVCGSSQVCLSGVCTTRCQRTSDCPAGFACNGSTCTTSCNVNQPCHGGCCSGGTCTNGLSAAACGTSGGVCTNCSSQSTNTACVSGACGCNVAADCPPLNACSPSLHACSLALCGGANTGCNGGCCTNLASGGTCVAGSSDTQCGGTGGQCANCQTGCNPGPLCIANTCGCRQTSDCLAAVGACSSQGLACSDAGACHM